MEILKLLKRACPRACPLRAFYYAPSGKPLCLTEWQSLEGWVGKLRWLGCGLHRLRMRVQSPVGAHTSARECISKWNNQSMFLTLPPHPSLGGGDVAIDVGTKARPPWAWTGPPGHPAHRRSSAEAPSGRRRPRAGRPGRTPGTTRSSSFCGPDTRTCLSRRT